MMNLPLRQIKRLIVLVVGGTVLLVGIAMIVLPGPAFIVIPTGLAILAVEFEWARRLLRKAKTFCETQTEAWKQKGNNANTQKL